MSGIAAIGVVVNVILALVLGEHHVHMPGASLGHDHSHEHNQHKKKKKKRRLYWKVVITATRTSLG